MQVPHKAVVLVADGRKMLFFRNEGDGEHLNLRVLHAEEQDNPKDGDQKTDQAGGSSGTNAGTFAGGGAGASMGEADYHQQEEDRFAADAAAMLRTRALRHEFEQLIVVAPPKTLGEMRKHYHKEVESRLAGELAKDLTGHPVADIEKALQAA